MSDKMRLTWPCLVDSVAKALNKLDMLGAGGDPKTIYEHDCAWDPKLSRHDPVFFQRAMFVARAIWYHAGGNDADAESEASDETM